MTRYDGLPAFPMREDRAALAKLRKQTRRDDVAAFACIIAGLPATGIALWLVVSISASASMAALIVAAVLGCVTGWGSSALLYLRARGKLKRKGN